MNHERQRESIIFMPEIVSGQWIEVTTARGGAYTAQVVDVSERGIITLDLALYDHVTGGILVKRAWLFPGEIVTWVPTASPFATL